MLPDMIITPAPDMIQLLKVQVVTIRLRELSPIIELINALNQSMYYSRLFKVVQAHCINVWHGLWVLQSCNVRVLQFCSVTGREGVTDFTASFSSLGGAQHMAPYLLYLSSSAIIISISKDGAV